MKIDRLLTSIGLMLVGFLWICLNIWGVLKMGVGILILPAIIFFAGLILLLWRN